jgi:CubicO group peptidase (beta-lactamase class C family)
MTTTTERPTNTDDAALTDALSGIQQAIADLVDQYHVPGAAVGIVREQKLAWFGGFGFADFEAERVPDEHTLYRVGSITKTFTATAIVQLRDEGKLGLDDPLVRHVPEFAAARNRFGPIEEVTLRRMLTHRSGLMGEPPLSHWETLVFPTMQEILDSLPNVEVSIEPDSAFKYSNLAFSLLGEVVARVSGRPYVEYVRERILAPLGMEESAFALDDRLRGQMATGYDPDIFAHPTVPAPHPLIDGMAAAGQLYSTVHDLATWIGFQLGAYEQDERVGAHGGAPRHGGGSWDGSAPLPPRSLREMHRPLFMEPGWSAGYCLAWMALRRGDNVYIGHGGGIHGFITQVLLNAEHRTGAVVLTNGISPAGEIAVEVLERVIAAEQEGEWRRRPRPRPTATPEDLRRYLGFYVGAIGGQPLHVEYRDGGLRLVMPLAGSAPPPPPMLLEPADQPHVFTVKNQRYAGEPLTFRLADDGTVTGFSSSGFVYKRLVEAGG